MHALLLATDIELAVSVPSEYVCMIVWMDA